MPPGVFALLVEGPVTLGMFYSGNRVTLLSQGGYGLLYEQGLARVLVAIDDNYRQVSTATPSPLPGLKVTQEHQRLRSRDEIILGRLE